MTGHANLKINYLALFFLFSCIKLSAEDGPEKIEVEHEISRTDNIINRTKLYQIYIKNGTNMTNFYKIEVEFEDKSNNNYTISYYKDEFKNRNQLSRSISGKAYMWLSKAQMTGGAKISLECNSESCKCNLFITPKDKIELSIEDKPYTYYVTEENKDLEFHITGDIKESNPKDCNVSIWAKGNKNIESNLSKESKYLKKRGYQAYLMKGSENITNCTLKVKGTIGDLIQVGVLIINKDKSVKTEINFPVLGFFKKGELDEIHFEKFDKNNFVVLYDQESSVYPVINSNNKIKLDEKYGEEYFYSFEVKKEGTDNLYQISPIVHGVMHEIKFEKKRTLGLIPMTPEDNFDYLTYYVKEVEGKFKASILSCDNYPLCKPDTKKEAPLLFYDSSSFTFKKDNYKDISAISKKQNILILRCENESGCRVYVNMYTNKNKVTLNPNVTLFKNIKENTEENFIISLINADLPDNSKKYVSSLNIEKLSGEIDVKVDDLTSLNHENKMLFEKSLGVKDILNIKIKATKNSTYNIAFYYEKESNTKILPSQANCLIKFNDSSSENHFIINPKYSKENLIVSLSALNSNISVAKSEKKLQFNEKRKFIQELYEKDAKYNVKKENNSNFNFYSVSTFRFDNSKKHIDYGILEKGTPYPVLFGDSKCKQANYMYLFDDLREDLKVNFTLFEDTNYEVKLLINGKDYNKSYTISKNESKIDLNKDAIKNYYVKEQPYKVNLIVKPNENKNSILEIVINPGSSNANNVSPSNKDGESSIGKLFRNKKFIIGASIILVLLIILIVAICLLCYTSKTYKNLSKQVNNISFKDGIDREGKDDELLE